MDRYHVTGFGWGGAKLGTVLVSAYTRSQARYWARRLLHRNTGRYAARMTCHREHKPTAELATRQSA